MSFKRFLRAYKIHSRTSQPIYFVAKNHSELCRILRYINSRHVNFEINVYDPNYLDGFTVPRYDDELYDSYMEDYE